MIPGWAGGSEEAKFQLNQTDCLQLFRRAGVPALLSARAVLPNTRAGEPARAKTVEFGKGQFSLLLAM